MDRDELAPDTSASVDVPVETGGRAAPLSLLGDEEEVPTRIFVGGRVLGGPEDAAELFIGEPFVEPTLPEPFGLSDSDGATTASGWRPPAMDLRSEAESTRRQFVCTLQRWPTVLDRQPLLFVGQREALDAEMLSLAETICVAAGSPIYKQGHRGQLLYVVDSGAVAVHRQRGAQQDLGTIATGLFFGEVGAISGMPSTTSAVAIDRTMLRVFSQDKLKLARQRAADSAAVELLVGALRGFYLETALALCPLLAEADEETRWRTSAAAPWTTFRPGEALATEGEDGNLCLIVVGMARVVRAADHGEDWLGHLCTGDLVGELAVSPVTVRAESIVSAVVIPREAVLELPKACRVALCAHITACRERLSDVPAETESEEGPPTSPGIGRPPDFGGG